MAIEADNTPAGSEPPKDWSERVDATIMAALEDSPEHVPAEEPETEPEAEEGDGPKTKETEESEQVEEEQTGPDWDLEDDDDYAAYQALRKLQWPDRLLKQLGRDELRMRGRSAAKMIAETDRRLSTKGTTTEADGAERAEPDKGRTPAAPAIEQSARTIADTLGLEGSEAEAVTAALTKAIEPLMQRIEGLQAYVDGLNERGMVAALGEEIPELKDAAYAARVARAGKGLIASGVFDAPTNDAEQADLYRAAHRALNQEAPSKSEKQKQQKRDHWKKHGVPNGTAAKQKAPAPKNELDRIVGIMDAVEQGVPEQEIYARFRPSR